MEIKSKILHTIGISTLISNAAIILWMFYLEVTQGYARFIEPNLYILYIEFILSFFGLWYSIYISILIMRRLK